MDQEQDRDGFRVEFEAELVYQQGTSGGGTPRAKEPGFLEANSAGVRQHFETPSIPLGGKPRFDKRAFFSVALSDVSSLRWNEATGDVQLNTREKQGRRAPRPMHFSEHDVHALIRLRRICHRPSLCSGPPPAKMTDAGGASLHSHPNASTTDGSTSSYLPRPVCVEEKPSGVSERVGMNPEGAENASLQVTGLVAGIVTGWVFVGISPVSASDRSTQAPPSRFHHLEDGARCWT